jgi:hypothetical protein
MKFSLPIANDLQELACRAACAFYFLGYLLFDQGLLNAITDDNYTVRKQ